MKVKPWLAILSKGLPCTKEKIAYVDWYAYTLIEYHTGCWGDISTLNRNITDKYAQSNVREVDLLTYYT